MPELYYSVEFILGNIISKIPNLVKDWKVPAGVVGTYFIDQHPAFLQVRAKFLQDKVGSSSITSIIQSF